MLSFNTSLMHLGRQKARVEQLVAMPKMRTFLSTYALAAVPLTFSWSQLVQLWPMLDNDQIGDCTLAGLLHLRQLWKAALGVTYLPTNAEAISLYQRFGYNPADPSTDQGVVEADVLSSCKLVGFDDGTKLDTYVAVNAAVQSHIKYAIWQFGGIYLGVALPLITQTQAIWDVAPLAPAAMQVPGSWGDHCVIGVDYDTEGIWVVTWGRKIYVTWAWCAKYFEEAWAVVSPDFMDAKGETPLGFDLAACEQADLALAA